MRVSAQSRVDIVLDCILGMYEGVLFVIITLFLLTDGWKLLIRIIGISFRRNRIFIENSLFLKMLPEGLETTSWQLLTDQ